MLGFGGLPGEQGLGKAILVRQCSSFVGRSVPVEVLVWQGTIIQGKAEVGVAVGEGGGTEWIWAGRGKYMYGSRLDGSLGDLGMAQSM